MVSAEPADGADDEPGGDQECKKDTGEDADVAEVALDVVVLRALANRQARPAGGVRARGGRRGGDRGRCAPRLLARLVGDLLDGDSSAGGGAAAGGGEIGRWARRCWRALREAALPARRAIGTSVMRSQNGGPSGRVGTAGPL